MLHSIGQRLEIGFLPFHYDFGKQSSKIDSQMDSCVKKIKLDIIDALNSRNRFASIAPTLISQVYSFRVLTLKWIFLKNIDSEDFTSVLDTFNSLFVKDKVSGDKYELVDNINFAIRTNLRVVSKFSKGYEDYFEKIQESDNSNAIASIPQDYHVFLALMLADAPPVLGKKIVNWVDISLLLEISLLASLFIIEDNLKLSRSKLNQISSFVANTAQEYGASAMELGILTQNINLFDIEKQKLSNEDSILLEQGLAEYVLNL